MDTPNFIQTPFDLNDAHVIGVNKDGRTARVLLELADTTGVAAYFTDVTGIWSEPNGGMHILGIAYETTPQGSRYNFINADDDNDGRLAFYTPSAPTIALY